MKRKITELEESLLSLGFHLDSKTYSGKLARFTRSYIYRGKVNVSLSNGDNMSIATKVFIDKKRNEIESIKIINLCDEWIDSSCLQMLNECYEKVKDCITKQYDYEETSRD